MAELEDDRDINPFSPEGAPGFQLIALMRLYDVGMAILDHLDPERADLLHEAHAQGRIVGSLPTLNLEEPT